MPTRIPIYRDDMFERMDKDKAEIKREINDVALLILKRLDACECKEVKKPIPIKKK